MKLLFLNFIGKQRIRSDAAIYTVFKSWWCFLETRVGECLDCYETSAETSWVIFVFLLTTWSMVSLIQHDCTLHGWACMAWKSRGSPEAPTDLPSRTSCCSYVTVSVVLRLVMVLDFIDAGSNFNIGLCQNKSLCFIPAQMVEKSTSLSPAPPRGACLERLEVLTLQTDLCSSTLAH